jgi:hypothetical protein
MTRREELAAVRDLPWAGHRAVGEVGLVAALRLAKFDALCRDREV